MAIIDYIDVPVVKVGDGVKCFQFMWIFRFINIQ